MVWPCRLMGASLSRLGAALEAVCVEKEDAERGFQGPIKGRARVVRCGDGKIGRWTEQWALWFGQDFGVFCGWRSVQSGWRAKIWCLSAGRGRGRVLVSLSLFLKNAGASSTHIQSRKSALTIDNNTQPKQQGEKRRASSFAAREKQKKGPLNAKKTVLPLRLCLARAPPGPRPPGSARSVPLHHPC